jgi:hypothetical protein
MLGFKSMARARIILGGVEMIHMMPKRQARLPSILGRLLLNNSASSLHRLGAEIAICVPTPTLRQNRAGNPTG